MPIPMPFPIRAVLIGITVSARKDKPGPKKQSNELALLEFSLARTYYFERLWVVVANDEAGAHSELIKPLSQKRIVIEVKYGNEEKIENTISVYRQLVSEPDGRGVDETPQG
jgi:CRISPR/Cas system-associated exonuclease Cas4 (RecB family)